MKSARRYSRASGSTQRRVELIVAALHRADDIDRRRGVRSAWAAMIALRSAHRKGAPISE